MVETPRLTCGVLGVLQVQVDGVPVNVGGARLQTVLAMLLLDTGRVITVERFMKAIWSDSPPPTARVQIQIAISRLRDRLRELGLDQSIATYGAGYRIELPEDAVDLMGFRRLVAQGRAAARRGEVREAAAALQEALGLWRGDALAGLTSTLLRSAALALDEERLTVTEEHIDLRLAMGSHREVVGDLRALVAAHPLRERLYGQLMIALYRAGRQAEALEIYRSAHRILADEHGIDPSEDLRTLERAILAQDPALNLPPAEQLAATATVPRQLPAPPVGFVGRDDIVAKLRQLLIRGDSQEAAVVAVVTGPAGVGKTALAVHTAHQVVEHFPDGQLFSHLRDRDSRPVPPERTLDQLLRSLGVLPAAIPRGLGEQAAMFRDRLASRRALVLLDDVAAAWQVEALLPGAGGVVLATSRGALTALRGIHRFDLGVLSPEMSRQLLSEVLGAPRVQAEPAEVTTVIDACGHLPLALQVAAAKLVVRDHWQISRLARRLADESRRLDELSLDGAGVRASVSVSFQELSGPARRLLPVLGGLGSIDFAAWVGGPLLGVDAYEGADVLEELVDARLVEVQSGNGYHARYRLHDLVGAFAREVLATEVPAQERVEAQNRLLSCWLFLARQAHEREYGGDYTAPHSDASLWPLATDLVDEMLADPMAWFESERTNLVAAVRRAAELDEYKICWDLAVTSVTLFERRAHRKDWRETHDVALEAAARHHDPRAIAVLRWSSAGLALAEHRLADAVPDLRAAIEYFERAGEPHGRGLTLRSLAFVDRLQGRHEQARERYQRAIQDIRSIGDRATEAHILGELADICLQDGGENEAEAMLSAALEICTDVGIRRVEAQVRRRLGDLYLTRGEFDLAEQHFTTMCTIVTDSGDRFGYAHALRGLGAVQLAQGRYELAGTLLGNALAEARQAGARLSEGRALLALAELAHRTGDKKATAERLDSAEALFRETTATALLERCAALRRETVSD